MFLIYSLGVGYIIARWHTLQILPLALATFGVIALPGLLFIGAWTLAFSSVIWTPLYQFLFIGYWFWGNYYAPGMAILSLACTPLTPIGRYAAIGFFHQDPDLAATCGLTSQSVSVLAGIGSIVLLLVTAALAILALRTYKDWRAASA